MSTSGSSVGQVQQGPHFVPLGMALTPRSLLKRHKLPTAAHLHTPTPPPGLDLSRPLLLYNTYNSTKVRGVSLRPGKTGALIPQGPSIVIPDSYTGWFAIMTSDGHTASFYSTVEQIASSKANFFLTRYDVPSYTKTEDKDGTFSYQKSVVQSGHVLKLLGIFEDLNARHTNSTGRNHHDSSSSSSSVFSCDKYAQCLNYKNEVVFLPFSASGRFYTTAHKNSKNPNHVYLMAHILKNHRLPITVRLVCGYMPRVPCNFTGMLRLEQAQKESVILACTMTNEAQATLFEIDVSSNFALTPVTDPIFPKTPIYLKTVSYCEDEADAWRRQIKVTHHVTEKRSRSLTRSLSDKFVEPLSNIRPLSFSFLSDHDKRKGRERDSSREGRPPSTSKDKSRDFKFKDFRRRDNSVEKTKFTYHDNSNNGYNSYPLKDSSREHKKAELRKISKQNTYVLQNGKTTKQTEKKTESESSSFISIRSVDNMEYSRVIDDISPMSGTTREEGEDHYAEICSHTLRNNNSHKSDGPLSLPNISLFQTKKGKEPASRKYSNSSINSNSASLKSQSSLKNPVRRVISNSSSESESNKISVLSHGNKMTNDIVFRKERTSRSRFLENFREKISHRNTVTEPERVFEKDKDDEVCCEDVIKRNKFVLKDFRDVEKKHSLDDNMERNFVDKPSGSLQYGSSSSGNTKNRENVNDVYIIRVVVKDRENNNNSSSSSRATLSNDNSSGCYGNMSTLAKDNSGGCYMKIRGYEAPKDELRNVIDVNEVSGYNSLC